MSGERLSTETGVIEKVLAEHRDDMECGDYGEVLWSGCTCGDEHPYDEHDRHIAEVLVADGWRHHPWLSDSLRVSPPASEGGQSDA